MTSDNIMLYTFIENRFVHNAKTGTFLLREILNSQYTPETFTKLDEPTLRLLIDVTSDPYEFEKYEYIWEELFNHYGDNSYIIMDLLLLCVDIPNHGYICSLSGNDNPLRQYLERKGVEIPDYEGAEFVPYRNYSLLNRRVKICISIVSLGLMCLYLF